MSNELKDDLEKATNRIIEVEDQRNALAQRIKELTPLQEVDSLPLHIVHWAKQNTNKLEQFKELTTQLEGDSQPLPLHLIYWTRWQDAKDKLQTIRTLVDEIKGVAKELLEISDIKNLKYEKRSHWVNYGRKQYARALITFSEELERKLKI